jgi:hypothetical protein
MTKKAKVDYCHECKQEAVFEWDEKLKRWVCENDDIFQMS